MCNFLDLSIDIYPFKNKIELLSIERFSHTTMSIDNVNVDFVNFLKSTGIEIAYVECFYSPPGYVQPIHIDGLGGDYVKINFVIGGNNSLMHWYKEKINIKSLTKTTIIGTSYKSYTTDQVELIESHSIKFPTLVQVGVPHNIINSFESRMCISFVCKNMSNKFLSMSDARSKLQKYIK